MTRLLEEHPGIESVLMKRLPHRPRIDHGAFVAGLAPCTDVEEVVVSFERALTLSGSSTGPAGGITVTTPSPARPLEAFFNSAVTLQTQIALNRITTEASVNRVLMDADVEYQSNKVGGDEIKASLQRSAARGIQMHREAVRRQIGGGRYENKP